MLRNRKDTTKNKYTKALYLRKMILQKYQNDAQRALIPSIKLYQTCRKNDVTYF